MLVYRILSILIFFLVLISPPATAQEPVLLKAHSHNDYKHKRPLYDALANRFFSIEADVFHENGSFFVAHTSAGIRQKNTLEILYLIPLEKRIGENSGRVYSNGPLEFELIIDLKGDWNSSHVDSLGRLLQNYRSLFTVFSDGMKVSNAVKIILSGNGAKYSVANDNPRFFSIDGRFDDISSEPDSNVICRTSANFRHLFEWRGLGEMKEREKELLHKYVRQAHASGRKIRFWAATNRKKVWRELLDAGVDWISVDKLKKFRNFYSSYTNLE